MPKENSLLDAVIIGGSYAGLSAAMAMGRALRRVLILDGGEPCNRQAPQSHNLITQDGVPPAEIAAIARRQVLAYPTIEFVQDKAVSITGSNNQFVVTTQSGRPYSAKKILFATGIRDRLPDLPGFSDCWGNSIIHCPYCHGYEFRGQKTGILYNLGETRDADHEVHFGQFIHNWTPNLTLFTNGPAEFSPQHQQALAEQSIAVVENRVAAVLRENSQVTGLLFEDGTQQSLEALYAKVPFELSTELPQQLGCELNKMGLIHTDEFQKTSVPGVYAAGDNCSLFRSVAGAIAAGSKAGAFMTHELIKGH